MAETSGKVSWRQAFVLAGAGALAGLGGSIGLALAAGWLAGGRGEGLQDLAAVVLGMFAGFVISCPAGVWFAGTRMGLAGSGVISFAASIAAGFLGIGVPNLLPVNAFTQTMIVSVPLFSLVASVAAYTFTHTRRVA
jgi:hypothetical protein